MELMTFSVPTFRLAAVVERLAKLARKAAKYGNGDIAWVIGDTKLVERQTEYGPREYYFTNISVSGEAPKIAGWSLRARIELLGEENLVHVIPGSTAEIDTRFRSHDGHCDHCNTLRRRNDVYVLTDGEKQIAVGRQCLRDFLGIDDPKMIVNRAQFFEELKGLSEDEEDWGNFKSHGYLDLLEVLSVAAYYIRTEGYVSKAKQNETGEATTGDTVLLAITSHHGRLVNPTEDDISWAKKTIEFFRSAESFKSDYLNNIRVLVKDDAVRREHVALVSSGVLAVQRELAARVAAATEAESNFVGSVKERLKSLELRLEKIIYLGAGTWGSSYLHLFKDATGNLFSWITTEKLHDAPGTNMKVDATVKEHKIYNGKKQTVLTRVKVL
jgi:hypothetical protein